MDSGRINASMYSIGRRRRKPSRTSAYSPLPPLPLLLLFTAGMATMCDVGLGGETVVALTDGGLRHHLQRRGPATDEGRGSNVDDSIRPGPPIPETGLRPPRRERHRLLHGAGGGGGGGGSFFFGGGRHGYDDERDSAAKLFFIVMGFLGIMCCFCLGDCVQDRILTSRRETLRASNRSWVLNGGDGAESAGRLPHPTTSLSPQFPSGKWRGYYRHGIDHAPFRFDLQYRDPIDSTSTAGTLSGSGSDDVGQYTIEGLYNRTSGRMALTKRYTPGTGNPGENKGHSVEYRGAVRGCLAAGIRGRWDVITNDYCDNGAFHMWPEFRYTVGSHSETAPKQVAPLSWSASPSAPPPPSPPEAAAGAMSAESRPLLGGVCEHRGDGGEAQVAVGGFPVGFDVTGNDDEEDECAVCFDSRVDTILRPCGHVAICWTCARVLDRCPICRARIDSVGAYEYGRRRGRRVQGGGLTAVPASVGQA